MTKVLRPIHPNAGLEIEFRRKLRNLIEKMHNSVLYWLSASYKANEPLMAMDSPASEIRAMMRRLTRRWMRDWNEGAEELARYFAKASWRRTDAQLMAILKKAGISVKFTMTPAMRDILHATIHQNVALIKSIPQQYLGQVEQLVMQSVQQGRKLDVLTKSIEKKYQLSRKRAALIARDQNNKATSAMTRARQTELGIKEAVWLHSHGGRKPRPTHLANNGKRYDVTKGWYDPHERMRIFPGELINCRCVSKSVIAGFS